MAFEVKVPPLAIDENSRVIGLPPSSFDAANQPSSGRVETGFWLGSRSECRMRSLLSPNARSYDTSSVSRYSKPSLKRLSHFSNGSHDRKNTKFYCDATKYDTLESSPRRKLRLVEVDGAASISFDSWAANESSPEFGYSMSSSPASSPRFSRLEDVRRSGYSAEGPNIHNPKPHSALPIGPFCSTSSAHDISMVEGSSDTPDCTLLLQKLPPDFSIELETSLQPDGLHLADEAVDFYQLSSSPSISQPWDLTTSEPEDFTWHTQELSQPAAEAVTNDFVVLSDALDADRCGQFAASPLTNTSSDFLSRSSCNMSMSRPHQQKAEPAHYGESLAPAFVPKSLIQAEAALQFRTDAMAKLAAELTIPKTSENTTSSSLPPQRRQRRRPLRQLIPQGPFRDDPQTSPYNQLRQGMLTQNSLTFATVPHSDMQSPLSAPPQIQVPRPGQSGASDTFYEDLTPEQLLDLASVEFQQSLPEPVTIELGDRREALRLRNSEAADAIDKRIKGAQTCGPNCDHRSATLWQFVTHLDLEHVPSYRRFKCPHDACIWHVIGFHKRTEARRHVRSQHGEPQFVCPAPHCRKKFARQDSFLRHFLTVHRPGSAISKLNPSNTANAASKPVAGPNLSAGSRPQSRHTQEPITRQQLYDAGVIHSAPAATISESVRPSSFPDVSISRIATSSPSHQTASLAALAHSVDLVYSSPPALSSPMKRESGSESYFGVADRAMFSSESPGTVRSVEHGGGLDVALLQAVASAVKAESQADAQ